MGLLSISGVHGYAYPGFVTTISRQNKTYKNHQHVPDIIYYIFDLYTNHFYSDLTNHFFYDVTNQFYYYDVTNSSTMTSLTVLL